MSDIAANLIDDDDKRKGTAAIVLASLLFAGFGAFVVWALYQPIYALSGQVR